ncbi:unnamed protein product [Albugo candida]|uniref:Glucose-methanol-choline oxidoreductase C-terminal domain-containing protein n=1 Tax=Albugo candida TaxID=65357 RepID=A0A024GDY7_9STRA|nr:unnamed protein product [Albugo candida]|eukprot:CCI45091.1 unnamed protein product [Albugo candida]
MNAHSRSHCIMRLENILIKCSKSLWNGYFFRLAGVQALISNQVDLFEALTGQLIFRNVHAMKHIVLQCEQPAGFDAYRGHPIPPNLNVQLDDEIDAWFRQHAESAYHPFCTNRLGSESKFAIDPHIRVCGVDGVGMIDALVMPNIISGKVNARTIMLVEKEADIIVGNEPLEKKTYQFMSHRAEKIRNDKELHKT